MFSHLSHHLYAFFYINREGREKGRGDIEGGRKGWGESNAIRESDYRIGVFRGKGRDRREGREGKGEGRGRKVEGEQIREGRRRRREEGEEESNEIRESDYMIRVFIEKGRDRREGREGKGERW